MPCKCRTRPADQNSVLTPKFETIEFEAGLTQALGLTGPGKLVYLEYLKGRQPI
jgi:hypothetical protein